MNFNFIAPHIIFGAGQAQSIAEHAAEYKRIVLVTGKSADRHGDIISLLEKSFSVQHITIDAEPTISMIQEAVDTAKSFRAELIVALGGGSVIDAGKAIAGLATNSGEILDYLEVIGKGKALENNPLPSIAIPTTAGTGSEVTKNAVIQSQEHHVKVSLRHNSMIPNIAIVDPELTLSMPPTVTAYTGLDALTQLIEPFISPMATPLTDAICREGLKRAARSLKKAFQHGENLQAREDMAIASVFGGLALANAKLGAVHGFAGPIGGMFNAPHGAVCASLLAHVLEMNYKSLAAREPDSASLFKLKELAVILTQAPTAKIQDGIEWVEKMCNELGVPSLSTYGVQQNDFESIAAKAEKAGSMKGNPIILTRDELLSILQQAY